MCLKTGVFVFMCDRIFSLFNRLNMQNVSAGSHTRVRVRARGKGPGLHKKQLRDTILTARLQHGSSESLEVLSHTCHEK